MSTSFVPRMASLWAGRFLAFAFAVGLSFALRADDPARFLAVTNWYATFSHTLNESGTFDYTDLSGCAVATSWAFHHSVTVSFQMVPDPLTVGNPYIRRFMWLKDNSANFVVNDQFDQTTTCSGVISGHHGWTVNNTGAAPTTTNVSMIVNILGPMYDIDVTDLNIPVAERC